MLWLSLQSLTSAVCIVQFIYGAAALDITFPRAGTNYSSSPYHIEWQPPGPGDPSSIIIYLATYNASDLVTNYLEGKTVPADPGSYVITGFSEGAPPGNSWTWQFYDANKSVSLGKNQVAESQHFIFPQSLITSPSPDHRGLSAGGAAGVAITVVILVLSIGAFVYYFFVHRRKQGRGVAKPNVEPVPPHEHLKPELDASYSGHGGSKTPAAGHYEMHTSPMVMSSMPANANELSAITQHELPYNAHGYSTSELPAYTDRPQSTNVGPGSQSRHSTIKRKELPARLDS